MYFWTSEAVSKGHPDKAADQIADSILDAVLAQDPTARVASEVTILKDFVLLSGEISTTAKVNYEEVARNCLIRIGYDRMEHGFDARLCEVVNKISAQSPEIAAAVIKANGEIGAGDQGIMFGYATNETPTYMPWAHHLAFQFIDKIEEDIARGRVSFDPKDRPWDSLFRPDAKTQVTLQYNDSGRVQRVDTVVISVCHKEGVTVGDLHGYLYDSVIKPVQSKYPELFDKETKYLVNPAGPWNVGGPASDTGLSGRKIVVDNYGPDSPIGGGSFCVDGETEFLSRSGWKKISDYHGEDVAQWHEDGSISFVIPSEYIVAPAENMFRVETRKVIDQVLSAGHNVVYVTSKGHLAKKSLIDLMSEHDNSKSGSHALLPVAFTYRPENSGIKLTDDELRLQIAAISDGCHRKGRFCRFRFKKSRKIKRMRELLERMGLDGNERNLSDGYTYFSLDVPTDDNHFPSEYWAANSSQLKIIAEELPQWDGDPQKLIYRTTCKSDADFAQFVLMSVYGTRVSILEDDRVGNIFFGKYIRKSICYIVGVCKNKLAGLRNPHSGKATITGYIPADSKQYCFTVPSGMLLLRRSDNVFVTGNSGKDPTKVDRSAAYAARHLAKNIVAAGEAQQVWVQLSYAIGVVKPISIRVMAKNSPRQVLKDGYWLDEYVSQLLTKLVQQIDLSPKGIIDRLGLRRPIYTQTASGGHFGREKFPWEQLDLAGFFKDEFRKFIPDYH